MLNPELITTHDIEKSHIGVIGIIIEGIGD
jgi:hypothetical protein